MNPKTLGCLLGITVGTLAWAAEPEAEPKDSPLKIIQSQRIVYPERMYREGVMRGEARIVFHIDSNGRLVDSLAVAYTAKPFAENALEALQRWKFVPSRANGRPGASVVHLTVRFETDGIIAIERTQPPSLDNIEQSQAGEFVYQPCPPHRLDQPLRPVAAISPDYPGALRRQGVEGVVRVNFYIDEKGKPRMVVATPDAHPALASLAIAAVEQWRFNPPTSGGKPVLVNAAQDFRFSATDEPRA